jgi:hypothetical protein
MLDLSNACLYNDFEVMVMEDEHDRKLIEAALAQIERIDRDGFDPGQVHIEAERSAKIYPGTILSDSGLVGLNPAVSISCYPPKEPNSAGRLILAKDEKRISIEFSDTGKQVSYDPNNEAVRLIKDWLQK